MEEEDPIFDPSLKKKKKKKKTPFDLDAALGGESVKTATEEAEEEKVEDEPAPEKEKADTIDLDGEFSSLVKKKKKKKKAFDFGELEEALPKEEEPEPEAEEETGGTELNEDDLNFSLPNKKKKKKKKMQLDANDMGDEFGDDEKPAAQEGPAWQGTDRDYTYEELLQRAFNLMREKNPDMVAGEKKRFVMKPPQVMKVGTKKSSFSNFSEICKMLHRQPKHVLAFLLAELGTSGSIDGNNQLIIKGRFQQKQIENVLRKYIKEYVTCHTCRSPETILQKDTRLYFLQCETCGSRCSVASIKSGFQAVTGKRAAIRAKTT